MIGESGNPPFDAQAMSEDQLFEQACAWHFRLQAEDLSAAERAAFAAWLACGQARIDAWDDVQRLLGALREPARAVHHAARARRASPAWGRWACAAVLVLGVALLALQMPWLDRLRADQATAVGESRLIELADGSRIQLNTDSAVQIALGEKERRVHLLRGEAWFEVAKNADRPFFVESGSGWVRVVGTRFSVARQGGRTQVRVGEGRVSVSVALVRDEGRYTSDSVDVYASGSFELLGRSHELVVGANTSEARTKSLNVRRTVAADIYTFDPDSIPRYDGVLGNWLPFDERSQDGLYLATRLRLADSLKLILGTRVSDYRYETSAGKATLKENGVVSPYAGLIYDLNDWSSVYLSYSDIFNPQSYKDASGNTLKPVVGSNYEAGIKGEFYEGRLNTAIAVFRLEQENLGKQDTYDLDACDGWCYIAAGLVISQGVDLSVNGEVLPGWQVSAGYTYVESKYGKGTQTGDPYASYLPEQILRASTSYALPGTDWTVGGDVRVQSEVYSEGTTGGTAYKVDQGGLALVGLMAKYRITDKADIGLRVANLFDRTYYERIGYPAYANFYGEPRNFNVTFRQAF